MQSYAIGVDLGGTNLRVAAVDTAGKLLEKISTSAQVASGRENVVRAICAAIREMQAKFSAPILGVGIGVPGIIDMASGTVRRSPNLPDWRDFAARDVISGILQAPVILENDANSAALGEHWMGAGQGLESMAMITLGTGVGGGLVLEGKVWHGMTGMAGEFGHVTVAPDGPACACGNRGCVEQFASATAIKRMAIEAIATGEAPELARAMKEDPEFSARVVFQMASEGDAPAKKIFERVGWALGILLADLVNIFNLPMIVIGGGVAAGWEAFAPTMMHELQQRSFVYAATEPEPNLPAKKATLITRALLGSDAGLYGAAKLALDKK